MKSEREYLEGILESLRAERSQLTVLLKQEQTKADATIDGLIRKSSVWDEIQAVKAQYERFKETLQRKNDHLSGKIEGLSTIYDEYYRFAVAPGTKMYGIDVSVLDWQTRARVMEAHRPTIMLLGGNPDGPKDEPEPVPVVVVAPEPVMAPVPAPTPVTVVGEPSVAAPVEPPNPQPAQRVKSDNEPISTKALLAQQRSHKKETAPVKPEPLKIAD